MALDQNSGVMTDLLRLTSEALPEVEALFARGREALRGRVSVGGKVSASAMEEHQFAAHSLSWLATYAAGLAAVAGLGGAACRTTASLARWRG